MCHQDSGDRSGQWEEVEGVDRGGYGGQSARTTRQSRGLSRRHENGPSQRLPLHRAAARPSVWDLTVTQSRPGSPGGESDGGVVGEAAPAGGERQYTPIRPWWGRRRFANPPRPASRPCRRRMWHLLVQIRHRTADAEIAANTRTLVRGRLAGKLLSPISTSAPNVCCVE